MRYARVPKQGLVYPGVCTPGSLTVESCNYRPAQAVINISQYIGMHLNVGMDFALEQQARAF